MSGAWPLPAGLPPGRLVVADPRYASGAPVTDPVLWVSDELVPDAGPLWARLLAEHPATGLWPLLLMPLPTVDFEVVPLTSGAFDLIHEVRYPGPGRPWHTGELSPFPASAAEALDVRELLATGWMLATTDTEGVGGVDLPDPPYPSWPGLAAPGTPGADPDQHAVSLVTAVGGVRALTEGTLTEGTDEADPFLGLVPSRDGAGAISACGWFCKGGDPAELTAVVRSWQQRFGARLCSLGRHTLYLAVAWPPTTAEHARRVAAEHWAFCPQISGFATFGEYADELVGDQIWSFYWE